MITPKKCSHGRITKLCRSLNALVTNTRKSWHCCFDPFIIPCLNSFVIDQVIDETLRVAGIAIWLMRDAKEDVEYQGKHGSFYENFQVSIACNCYVFSI